MPPDFRPRRALLLFLFVAVVAVVLGTAYRKMGRTKTAGPPAVLAKQELPPISTSQGSPSDATAFALAGAREISQLDGTITPAQWKALHPEDEPTEAQGYTCPSLVKMDSLTLGSQSTRTAYFYPPIAPSTAVMPALSGQPLIDSSCTLAMIRVEIPAQNPEAGHALAEALKEELSKKYAGYESVTGPIRFPVHFRGAGYWKEVARWKAADLEIISAYEAPGGVYPSAPADNFFVYAQLPIVSTIDHELCCVLKDYHYRAGENQQFHRAVALSGLNASLRLRMDQLYAQVYGAYSAKRPGEQPLNKNWRAPLVTILGEWLNSQKTLPPVQQAAALFAADRLVAAVEDTDRIELYEKPELRSELQSLGAGFTTDEPTYTKNWLERARELAPESEVGQMAVLAFISRGNCDRTGWDSEKVISEGESLLAKGLGEPTESHVHFILGDAYSDIVALAEGADPDRGDDELAKYRNEAEIAGTKALQHYRAGFVVDATSETARDAWLQAWHLSAGLLPRTRYVCGDI